jgi:hypothetical protein
VVHHLWISGADFRRFHPSVAREIDLDQKVRLIEDSPDRLISIVDYFEHLKEWFPKENLQELARTIIGWGRFAGLLVYSSVSLGLPEPDQPSAGG